MTTTIASDRGNRISVELQSDYWGEELVNSDRFIGGDAIRIDSHDEHLALTAQEARALAAALTAAADRLDAKACFICGKGPHRPVDDKHSKHSYWRTSDADSGFADQRGDGPLPSMTAAETLDPREAVA